MMARKIINKALKYGLLGPSLRMGSFQKNSSDILKATINCSQSQPINIRYGFSTSEGNKEHKSSKKSEGNHKFDADSSYF